MPAREGYGQTKVRNSPAPSKEWAAVMDRAMANRKKKKKKKINDLNVFLGGVICGNHG